MDIVINSNRNLDIAVFGHRGQGLEKLDIFVIIPTSAPRFCGQRACRGRRGECRGGKKKRRKGNGEDGEGEVKPRLDR